jgi:SAM-dependent methyltransferase
VQLLSGPDAGEDPLAAPARRSCPYHDVAAGSTIDLGRCAAGSGGASRDRLPSPILTGMKRTAAAALRNRAPLAAALRDVLPARGRVLELGSGTGEHAVFLAAAFPDLLWQPSDPDPDARASIAAWTAEARLTNLLPPRDWDLRLPRWQGRPADAVLCVNVLHVASLECTEALCEGAARVLPPGGPLAVYGPFTHRGEPLGARLARLEGTLRAADPDLGVREVEAVAEAGRRHGLALAAELPMPEEGDLLLVLRASGDAGPS